MSHADGAFQYPRQRWRGDTAEPFTAEEVRAAYHATVERQAATWK